MTEGKRKRRSNAGELYVSLRLKLLVSKATWGTWGRQLPGAPGAGARELSAAVHVTFHQTTSAC